MNIGRWYPTLVALADGGRSSPAASRSCSSRSIPIVRSARARTSSRPRPTTRRQASGTTTALAGQRSLPLFPRLSPPAERPRLLRRGRTVVQPVRPVLRRGAAGTSPPPTTRPRRVEGPRHPGMTDLKGVSHGPGRLDPTLVVAQQVNDIQNLGVPGGGARRPSRLPRLHVLDHAAARGRCEGRVHPGGFLTAGGVLSPGSPGRYMATSDSAITTIDTAKGDER